MRVNRIFNSWPVSIDFLNNLTWFLYVLFKYRSSLFVVLRFLSIKAWINCQHDFDKFGFQGHCLLALLICLITLQWISNKCAFSSLNEVNLNFYCRQLLFIKNCNKVVMFCTNHSLTHTIRCHPDVWQVPARCMTERHSTTPIVLVFHVESQFGDVV